MKEKKFVKTAIRWRPTDGEVIIKKLNEQAISFGSQPKTCCFDHVIDTSDQNEVYDLLLKPLVEKALEGYDCTFLASGQTGSGKTHTIGFESSVNNENNGMTPRVLNSIFSYADAKRVEVSISFIEVYNDQAFDLLGQNPQEPFLKKDLGMSGANRKSVQNQSQVLDLLMQGTKNRRVRGTRMNATSSRSHAVFTIKLRIQDIEDKIRESVINLVDLAGSECVDKTGNTAKESLVEGKSINESLSAFKRVIMAMSSGASHIPFRDSVITYILRKSLETNCYLTLLGCVSPFQRDYGETLSTLSFVADAKLIKRTPQLNAVINESQVQNSKTPAKSFQTPTSSLRIATPFSRPFSSNQSKLLLPPVPMSEPRKNRSISGYSSKLKLFGRKSIPNSAKKMMRQSFGVDRCKLVNRVLMNSNLKEAPTSSAVKIESREVCSTQKLVEAQHAAKRPEVNRVIERLAKEAEKMMDNGFNLNIIDIMGVVLNKINEENSTISGSFLSTPTQATVLSTIMENECYDDATLKYEPMKDQIFSVSSTEDPMIDHIPSQNVSMSCDHVGKKILFEVNKTTGDNVTIIDVPKAQIVSPEIVPPEIVPEIVLPDTTQETSLLMKGLFDEEIGGNSSGDPIIDPILSQNVSISCDHAGKKILFEVNKTTGDNVTTNDVPKAQIVSPEIVPEIVSPDTTQETSLLMKGLFDEEIGGNLCGESEGDPLNITPIFSDDILNNKTMENSSPIIKNITDTNMRTPIGKLIIRRVALSNQFETTQYAVEIVHKVRKPQQIIPEMSPPSFEMDHDYEVIEMTNTKAHPLTTKSPIASKARRSARHSSKPQRVSSIQDSNRHYSTQQKALQALTKLKRKVPQTESVHAKDIIPETSPPSFEMDYDYEVNERPKFKAHPLTTRSAIVSKARHSARHSPKPPRLLLHRVSSIEDYNRHYNTQQKSLQAVTKFKRKVPQTESALAKEIIPETSPPPFEMRCEYDVMEKPNKNAHPLFTSSPIDNRAAHSKYRFPKYPRLVLDRVSTIQDYLQQHPSQAATKCKRKVPQTKSARTKDSGKKSKSQHKETDVNNKILDILNTASEEGLRKQLATIGAKKAHQIFNYRDVKGKYKSIDGLLKMPFWSKKTHERFIAHNIFV